MEVSINMMDRGASDGRVEDSAQELETKPDDTEEPEETGIVGGLAFSPIA